MAINLIDLVSKEFSGDVLGKIAASLGEPEQKVQAAVGGAVPALVAAMAGKASASQGLGDIVDLMRQGGFDGSKVDLAGLLSGGSGLTDLVSRGTPIISALLGGRQGGVTDWLSAAAGISPRSSSSLLSLAAPAVLSVLGSQARKAGGLTSSVLQDLLGGQSQFLRDKAPAGLASALGFTDLSKLGPAHRVAEAVTRVQPVPEKGTNWWPWAALALAVLGLWWFVNRQPVGTIDPRISIAHTASSVATR